MEMTDQSNFQSWRLAIVITAALIAGCAAAPPALQREPEKSPAVPAAATPALTIAAPSPPAAAPAPAPPPDTTAAAKRDLAEGIELYDRGDYGAAISKLGNSSEISTAGNEIQITALKYMAFSFCLTRRQTLCRAQFEKAFKLDPAFDLAPAERGHPLWGPSFERVKKAQPATPK